MSNFSKRVVRHGDTTTEGGSVIAPGSNNTVGDLQVALAGDRVSCPKCRSIGTIVSVAPMPETYYDHRRYAFDGDLCVCLCPTPPRLISSATNWTASSFKTPVGTDPAAVGWLIYAGYLPAAAGLSFDQTFLLKNAAGAIFPNLAYRITLETGHSVEGVTDEAGLTQKIFSNSAHIVKIEAPYYGNTTVSDDSAHGYDSCSC